MKLYVGNLPFSVTSEVLRELFSAYNVEEANVIVNKFTQRSKGFGFVTVSDDAAEKAISEMNGKTVEGRELRVSEAKPMEEMPRRPPRRDFNRDRGNFNRRRF